MPTKTKKEKTTTSKKTTTKKTGLDARIKELEHKHGKVLDVAEELRIIGMEYADIRSRLETTDVMIEHMLQQLDVERRMRRVAILLTLIVTLLAAALLMSIGF